MSLNKTGFQPRVIILAVILQVLLLPQAFGQVSGGAQKPETSSAPEVGKRLPIVAFGILKNDSKEAEFYEYQWLSYAIPQVLAEAFTLSKTFSVYGGPFHYPIGFKTGSLVFEAEPTEEAAPVFLEENLVDRNTLNGILKEASVTKLVTGSYEVMGAKIAVSLVTRDIPSGEYYGNIRFEWTLAEFPRRIRELADALLVRLKDVQVEGSQAEVILPAIEEFDLDSLRYRTLALLLLHGCVRGEMIGREVDPSRIELAENYLIKSLAIKDAFRTHLLLGAVFLRRENIEYALTELQSARAKYPSHYLPHLLLGDLYLKSGDYENGDKEAEEALSLSGGRASCYLLQGRILLAQGDTQSALILAETALRADQNQAEGLLLRGEIRLQRGEKDEALADLKRALELAPDLRDAVFLLTDLYIQKRQYQDALDLLTKVERGEARDAYLHHRKGQIYYLMGLNKQAVEEYETSLKILPRFAQARNDLGWLYLNTGRYDQGLKEIRQALAILPTYAEAERSLAFAYYLKKDYSKAIETSKKAFVDGRDSLALFIVGASYVRLKKPKEASENFKKGLALKNVEPPWKREFAIGMLKAMIVEGYRQKDILPFIQMLEKG